jgi:hypothetical protein
MISAASPRISTIGLPPPLLLLRLPPLKKLTRSRMSARKPTATTSPKTIVETRMS